MREYHKNRLYQGHSGVALSEKSGIGRSQLYRCNCTLAVSQHLRWHFRYPGGFVNRILYWL